MRSINIRAARANDAEAILELWTQAAENADRPVDTAASVTAMLNRDPEALIVAEDEAGLLGTVVAGWDGWRAHLYRLAVHPAHRRRGIGRALLAAAEARLAGLGARRFDAMVLDENDLGHELWSATGYRRQDNWSRWVKRAGTDGSPDS